MRLCSLDSDGSAGDKDASLLMRMIDHGHCIEEGYDGGGK